MSGVLIAAGIVVVVGLALMMWIGARRALQRVDKLPDNNPVAFVRRRREAAGVSETTVVACVGDSITHGSISSNYVDVLASRCDATEYEFVNAGINGDLAYNVAQRLDQVIACQPDVVTVLIGTNDVNARTSRGNLNRYMKDQKLPRTPDEVWYRQNLTGIVERLRNETSARIALLSIPPIGENPAHPAFERSRAYGEIARAVATEAGVDFLPLRDRMISYLEKHPRNSARNDSHAHTSVVMVVVRLFGLGQTYEAVSRANGHVLLTDHLHLNDTAAGMVADVIEEYLTAHDSHVLRMSKE